MILMMQLNVLLRVIPKELKYFKAITNYYYYYYCHHHISFFLMAIANSFLTVFFLNLYDDVI